MEFCLAENRGPGRYMLAAVALSARTASDIS
jgi:hypothetical protein